METRRTNQFLRVALGARSPARPKYFKSKFYDNQQETKLNFPIGFQNQSNMSGHKTAVGGARPKNTFTSSGDERAKTTKDSKYILFNIYVVVR